MNEILTRIVARFTGLPTDTLQSDTPVGRKSFQSSIHLHRMYAALAKEGLSVPEYQKIQTFGELLKALDRSEGIPNHNHTISQPPRELTAKPFDVGIDIESVKNLPQAADFREDDFYKMNFTPREIAYCILKPDPYQSFAGLFAAKEAIVKIDPMYQNSAFNTIEIDHNKDGRPVAGNITLSISHSGDIAVAVAVSYRPASVLPPTAELVVTPRPPGVTAFIILSILLSLLAIGISLFG